MVHNDAYPVVEDGCVRRHLSVESSHLLVNVDYNDDNSDQSFAYVNEVLPRLVETSSNNSSVALSCIFH
jgi:hypothetical protein